jgi:hypothetical protein
VRFNKKLFSHCVRNSLKILSLIQSGWPYLFEKICPGRDLANVLAATELPGEEARAWRRDLQAARKKTLKAPGEK